MNDEQLLRYSRQILLPQWDIAGQEALIKASVLLVGAGGLGCPAAMYLAAAGVGRLIIADDDQVDLSNLQRQIAHTEADIGVAKVESLRQTLLSLNSHTEVIALPERLQGETLAARVGEVDLVVDCSDNFTTRHQLNRACVAAGKPLVSGAAIRFEGQVAVFDPRVPDAPCYRCLYSNDNDEALSCSENGVLSPVVGVVGAMQALEALKVLSGVGEPLLGKLLVFDGLRSEWRRLSLPKDPGCPVCGTN
ncbi:molybdopterin-synthase adenylyltransferase MoeB [Pseudomaricurvus sp. HS19]|uniref:HesA/MoeB/ThiF family protein n=1 Tax=Pseudomaricurvus sp. HS19 TaxID=2692626 RepID=UPI00136E7E4D|nr:molybdopterin-synthase adenylyltransferase MoeB [Pseudomaricurvus sp. HS19]MYM63216.1 molybdopterin-synthase adenylyltransferase MoeB [Pseudomaricurvus sp. HS19]